MLTPLIDSWGRVVNNLRISVTQRCNFNCFFCHQEGEVTAKHEMTTHEITEIARVAGELGVTKIKITGGEALLRRDIVNIITNISKYVDEVSLTTNGYFLGEKSKALNQAGLKRVNVSFHSNNPEKFEKITGTKGYQQVVTGITSALDNQLYPVKLNMVVLQGINDLEIPEMIKFAANYDVILQLIEFQPVHKLIHADWERYYFDLTETEKWLEKKAFKVSVRPLHGRKQYYLYRDEGPACVEVVKPMHNSKFCNNCTRLRVTSDGMFKPCLLRTDNLVNAVSHLRNKRDSKGLVRAFHKAVMFREPYWREEDGR
jgi:cyclic pyranopterin phosphate synthase